MNKLLFLYTDPSEKADLLIMTEALKAVFRKFRKSVAFSFLNIDFSPFCRSEMKKRFCESVSEADGIMFFGRRKDADEETLFFKECSDIHSIQYFSSGKCICYPVTVHSSSTSDNSFVEEISRTDLSSVEKTAKLAISCAMKKKELLLCTDTTKEADRIIYNEFTNSMNNTRGLDIEHFDFDEFISMFSVKIPSSDVILTTQGNVRVIASIINSLNKFPAGYSVYHSSNQRIYKREFHPYDGISNISYAGALIACGSMIENELGFKNAGVHLRKAVAQALEKCCYSSKSDFQNNLLFEIASPLRNRRMKT